MSVEVKETEQPTIYELLDYFEREINRVYGFAHGLQTTGLKAPGLFSMADSMKSNLNCIRYQVDELIKRS